MHKGRDVITEKKLPYATKTEYFLSVMLRYFPEMKVLLQGKLTRRDRAGQRVKKGSRDDWSNVLEHGIVLVAAAEELGKALGLTSEQIRRLAEASTLHDWRKRLDKSASDFNSAELLALEELYKSMPNDKFLASVTTPEYLQRGFIEDKATFIERLLSYLDAICHGSEIVPFAERLDKAAVSPSWRWLAEDKEWNKKLEPILGSGANFFAGQKAMETKTQQMIFERLQARGHYLEKPEDVPKYIRGLLEKNYPA